MKVTIDGTTYIPATDQPPRFGLGITTRNRPDTLATCLTHWRQHTPTSVPIVIVDDASTTPIPDATHRFEQRAGVARTKNKAIELLIETGVDHLFLADDDCYAIADEWWSPFVSSPEPHLMRIFGDLAGRNKLNDLNKIYDDGEHVAWTGARGAFLYAHRTVIDTVGGMDPQFGYWGWEHGDWSNRIYFAGLTTWRCADVAGSDKLIHCMDEHEEVTRTVPTAERQQLAKRNARLHNERMDAGYTAYVEYREQRDVVLTHLLTAQPDPQRGKQWPAEAKTIRAWADSITDAEPIVLVDRSLTGDPGPALVEQVPVAKGQSAYRARWTHSYRWLRAHPEVRWIWCTDGSDVEMLHEPWSHMRPGVLYVGSEPKTCADRWMRDNHPAQRYQDFLDIHANDPLLNCGLVGGDRATVLQLLHAMVAEFDSLAVDRFWKREPPGEETGDMGAFGRVIYRDFPDRHITGPAVHTIFRADERNAFSWWKHR